MATAVTLTLAEAAMVLDPPVSEQQLRQIVTALGWQPHGARHTGRAGRPVAAYDATRLLELHAALLPFIGDNPLLFGLRPHALRPERMRFRRSTGDTMARYSGTTTQRGLGTAHQKDRKRLLAIHRDGDPCWRCGQPMYKSQPLDRDHIVDRALGGAEGPAVLAHRSCNRSAGAKLGNRLQPQLTMAPGRDTICTACGKVYSRAPRLCEICGAHYHPNHGQQRSCSRACGAELRRRIYGPTGSRRTPKPKPVPKARPVREPIAPSSPVVYYTCRYCRKVGITKVTGQRREVCAARLCQLARLQANNLRLRNGLTREDADAQMAILVGATQSSRPW